MVVKIQAAGKRTSKDQRNVQANENGRSIQTKRNKQSMHTRRQIARRQKYENSTFE